MTTTGTTTTITIAFFNYRSSIQALFEFFIKIHLIAFVAVAIGAIVIGAINTIVCKRMTTCWATFSSCCLTLCGRLLLSFVTSCCQPLRYCECLSPL
jgi:hypothetical protein